MSQRSILSLVALCGLSLQAMAFPLIAPGTGPTDPPIDDGSGPHYYMCYHNKEYYGYSTTELCPEYVDENGTHVHDENDPDCVITIVPRLP